MFFVMLKHPNPSVPAVPLVDDDGDVVFFDDRGHACFAAEESSLGEVYGFEVFQLGSS